MGAERISEGKVKRALRRSPLRAAVIRRRHRGLTEQDVFIASFPRSGNTWLRFVLTSVVTGEAGTFEAVERISPAVGYHFGSPTLATGGGRLIKTHEPYRPEYRRAVYLVRDVRDVLMSYYRMLTSMKFPDLTVASFFDGYLNGSLDGYGTWHQHIRSWTTDRDPHADVLILRYEDMKADPPAVVQEIVEFIGIDASPDAIATALGHNSIAAMRELERKEADWGAKALGWRLQRNDIDRERTWRSEFSPEQLAMLAPAEPLLREFNYAV